MSWSISVGGRRDEALERLADRIDAETGGQGEAGTAQLTAFRELCQTLAADVGEHQVLSIMGAGHGGESPSGTARYFTMTLQASPA